MTTLDPVYGLYSTHPKPKSDEARSTPLMVWFEPNRQPDQRRRGRPPTLGVDTADMYADYRAGMSVVDIAHKWGISAPSVYSRFSRAGLPLRLASGATVGMYIDYCTGLSLAEVAEKWGCGYSTVRQRFNAMHLPLRPRSADYKHNPARSPKVGKGLSFEQANQIRKERASRKRVEQCRRVLPSVTDASVREVLQLRIDHPDLSLAELGERCVPLRTKDSVASVLRRAITEASS